MILSLRTISVFLLLSNFRFNSSKFNFRPIFSLFTDIKIVSFFVVKLIACLVVFLVLNYLSYIYYSLGLTIIYGYVLFYALALVFLGWILWLSNGFTSMIAHFLPTGIRGLLKLFIPLLEIVGVVIRPLTLAVRLATNIRCGHVVLLMFRYFCFNVQSYLVVSISLLLVGLYFIEFLVCVIQAYVPWRLLYIHLGEIEI